MKKVNRMKTKYLPIVAIIVLITLQMSCSTKKSSSLDTAINPAVASSDLSTQSKNNIPIPSAETTIPDSTKNTNSENDPYSVSIDSPITSPEIEITPQFDIVETSFEERSDKAESLYILIPTVNLDQRKYVTYIKNIVKKLIVYGGHSETISILIFDDEDSLNKIFQNPDDTDLNIPSHYIARYDGHMKGVTYDYNLTIFPLTPQSNPYVKNHHDTIKFNPFNW